MKGAGPTGITCTGTGGWIFGRQSVGEFDFGRKKPPTMELGLGLEANEEKQHYPSANRF